jgi:GDP-L-fucose synthase
MFRKWCWMKILIIGDRGFIGSSCLRYLKHDFSLLTLSNTQDLSIQNDDLRTEIKSLNPDAVLLAAGAKGLKGRKRYETFILNTAIQDNVINSCAAAGIERLLFLSSSAVYESCPPALEHFEDSNFDLNLGDEYGLSKINGMELCKHLNSAGYSYQSLILGNIYGEGEKFDLDSALLLPRIVSLTYQAIKNQTQQIVMSGSPHSVRDYLHIEDLMSAIAHLLINETTGGEWNIGTGTMTSNYNLANLISSHLNYKGRFDFDSNLPPDGLRPRMSMSKIQNSGWNSTIDLVSGVERTIKSFQG